MEKELWGLIERSKNGAQYLNPHDQYSNFVGILSLLEEDKILKLENVWRKKVRALVKNPEFEYLHVNNGGVVGSGDDGFYLDFANWLMAQGKLLYQAFMDKGHKQVLGYIKKFSVGEDEFTFENMAYAFGDALDSKENESSNETVTSSDISNLTEQAKHNYILSRLVIQGTSDVVGYRVSYRVGREVGSKVVPWSFDIALEDFKGVIKGVKERKLFEFLSRHSVIELKPYGDLYVSDDEINSGVNTISLEATDQIKAVCAGLKRWATI